MVDDMRSALVARAEAYPWGLAEEVTIDGFPTDRPVGADTAVVAIGSYLADRAAGCVAAVTTARLRDHAVVYAASISPCGSIPATIVPAAGATALVPVALVDGAAFARWHTTTRADSEDLIDVTASLEPRGVRALAPSSRSGPLVVNGQPLRLAELPTIGTRYAAAFQGGLLALLHLSCAASGEAYAAFVQDLATSTARRAEICRRLAEGLQTRCRS